MPGFDVAIFMLDIMPQKILGSTHFLYASMIHPFDFSKLPIVTEVEIFFIDYSK
jgi:hypothetical protein